MARCPDPNPHRGPHGWNYGASFERPFVCPGWVHVPLEEVLAEQAERQRRAALEAKWLAEDARLRLRSHLVSYALAIFAIVLIIVLLSNVDLFIDTLLPPEAPQ